MTPLVGVRVKEPAHKAWHWPHLLPKLEIPVGRRPKTTFLNLCPPPSALPHACIAVLDPWLQMTRVFTEVTTNAVGPRAPAVLGSLVQDVGLSGQFCRCPRQPRHRSRSRWVDWAQEGARLSLSSTLSDSPVCGPILNCPNVPAQEVVPWQGPTLQQTQMPCQVQPVLCEPSPKGGLSTFSIWCACAHKPLALSQQRPCDACVDPTDACSFCDWVQPPS